MVFVAIKTVHVSSVGVYSNKNQRNLHVQVFLAIKANITYMYGFIALKTTELTRTVSIAITTNRTYMYSLGIFTHRKFRIFFVFRIWTIPRKSPQSSAKLMDDLKHRSASPRISAKLPQHATKQLNKSARVLFPIRAGQFHARMFELFGRVSRGSFAEMRGCI